MCTHLSIASFGFAGLGLGVCLNAKADASYVMEEMVVTATRDDVLQFELPNSIYGIDEKALEDKQVRSLPEALEDTPGVLVQKTANGQGSPFLRGFTGYRTLALIDGVRYNNSVYRDGPNEYFSLIDANTLSRIELLSGPASTLYGSDAIGGTLNLKTKSANYKTQSENSFFSNGSQSYRFSSAERSHISRTEVEFGEGNSWGMHLGYSWKDFGNTNAADIGVQAKTGYDEKSWDARLDLLLSDNWDLTLVHQNLTQDDVWRTHSTIYAESYEETRVGSDLRRLKDQQRSLSYTKFTGHKLSPLLDEAQLTLSLQTWDENGDRIKSNGSRILDNFDSRMWGIDLQLKTLTDSVDYIYGFDYYRDNVDSGRIDYNTDGSIDDIRIQGPIGDNSEYSIFGAYVQAEYFYSQALTFTVGSRYTYTEANVGAYEDPTTNLSASYSDDWNSFVNSIRASYALTENGDWKLWGGISQSFRAPNIADVSRFGKSRSSETEVAATNLEPERFLTYEIGIKHQSGPFNATATYYYTDIKDFITSTPTGNVVDGLTEVSKRNSAEGYVQGIELTANYNFHSQYSLFTNATWLEGKLDSFSDTSSTTANTEYMSRIMPPTATVGMKWESTDSKHWASLSLTATDDADKLSAGDKSDLERIPTGGTPGYTLVNLRGGHQLTKSFSTTWSLENILDEAYRTHGSGSNEPGFGAVIGFKVIF